jgi:hypothetical protein
MSDERDSDYRLVAERIYNFFIENRWRTALANKPTDICDKRLINDIQQALESTAKRERRLGRLEVFDETIKLMQLLQDTIRKPFVSLEAQLSHKEYSAVKDELETMKRRELADE